MCGTGPRPNSEVKRECGTAIDGVVVIAKAPSRIMLESWLESIVCLRNYDNPVCVLVIGIPHVRLTLRGYLIGKCDVDWMEA